MAIEKKIHQEEVEATKKQRKIVFELVFLQVSKSWRCTTPVRDVIFVITMQASAHTMETWVVLNLNSED